MRTLLLLLLVVTSLNAQPATLNVSPELGGPGFERIAEANGWRTGAIAPDQFRYFADTNAKKGGRINVSIGEFPATLRTMGRDENSSNSRMINGLVYEALIGVNPLTLDFTPQLATHWKFDADDIQTFYFRIDPNARFSDGRPVTTEDVIATYDLGLDSTILSPYTNSFYAGYDRPEAISPYIVKVRARSKSWKNMLYFGGMDVLPAHYIKGMSGSEYLEQYDLEHLPGSGPYIISPKIRRRGAPLNLVRRRDWWQREYPVNRGQFNFDTIRIQIIGDYDLAVEKLKAGEIDYLPLSSTWQWNAIEGSDAFDRGVVQLRRVYTDDPPGVGGFVFNMRKPPFDDPRVREAFILLIDRETTVSAEYELLDSYFPGSIYENPNNRRFTYDPKRATELLAEAGYTSRDSEGVLVKNGTPLVVKLVVSIDMGRIVNQLDGAFERAGIRIEKEWKENSSAAFRQVQEREFDLSWMVWGGLLYPNPISSFHSSLADIPNTNNIAGFKNRTADSLIELELVTFDAEKRVAILRQLDSILIDARMYGLTWYLPYQRIAYVNRFGHPDFYLGRISDADAALYTWWVDRTLDREQQRARKNRSLRMEQGETTVKFWKQRPAASR